MASTRIGRPPQFTGPLGTSTTRVRLRLTRAEWQQLTRAAADRGMSFGELLRQRLRLSVADLLGHEPNKPATKMNGRKRSRSSSNGQAAKSDRPLLAMGG